MLNICGLGDTSCDKNDDEHSGDALKEKNGMKALLYH